MDNLSSHKGSTVRELIEAGRRGDAVAAPVAAGVRQVEGQPAGLSRTRQKICHDFFADSVILPR
jgi:hypothetical protein